MKAIYKYRVGTVSYGDHIEEVQVPKHAQFLYVGMQDGIICAWYMVDPGESLKRTDVWQQIGTGHCYEDDFFGEYKGSLVVEEYGLVWHMFVKQDV